MELEKRIEIFDKSGFCEPRFRTEHFCRYSFQVIMHKVDCPFYEHNNNPILGACNYKKWIANYSE